MNTIEIICMIITGFILIPGIEYIAFRIAFLSGRKKK